MVIFLIPLGRALLEVVVLRSLAADLCGRHSEGGSLAGAAHLLNDNAGVLG